MRQFVITRAAIIQGWAVRCNGETLSTHFSEGLAVADALRRAQAEADTGIAAQVFRHETDGRFTPLATLAASLPREQQFRPLSGTETGQLTRIERRAAVINDALT